MLRFSYFRLPKYVLSNTVMAACAALLLTGLLSGCTGFNNKLKNEQANHIAGKANLFKYGYHTQNFPMPVFERVYTDGIEATVYIGSLNRGLVNVKEVTPDPTPYNPVGLKLAALDKSENLLYIGPPCTYFTYEALDNCPHRYFIKQRFAPEVIDSYSEILDKYRARYDLKGFHLVGYGSGGAIAALLAKKHPEVLSLRTVAGVVDTDVATRLAEKPKYEGSLNPAEESYMLGVIPQNHFIGSLDQEVPPAVVHSYVDSMGPSRCVRTTMVQGASHNDGWVERWPALLNAPLDCKSGDIQYQLENPSQDAMLQEGL